MSYVKVPLEAIKKTAHTNMQHVPRRKQVTFIIPNTTESSICRKSQSSCLIFGCRLRAVTQLPLIKVLFQGGQVIT